MNDNGDDGADGDGNAVDDSDVDGDGGADADGGADSAKADRPCLNRPCLKFCTFWPLWCICGFFVLF